MPLQTNLEGLPGFLLIGAMKAGTTSLFNWIAAQSEVFVPTVKEPGYFGDPRAWKRGLEWYASLFADARPGQLTGEASVIYTHPSRSATVASRVGRVLPNAKLIFLARDPVERLRSHYKHEVLRGRERRRMEEVLLDASSDYVVRSLYFACLEPFVHQFPREQIHVAEAEDLFGADGESWRKILAFLGMDDRPRPDIHSNASADRAQFSQLARLSWDRGFRRPPVRLPQVVRRIARPVFIRSRPSPLLATAEATIPDHVMSSISDDRDRLDDWLGHQTAGWVRG